MPERNDVMRVAEFEAFRRPLDAKDAALHFGAHLLV